VTAWGNEKKTDFPRKISGRRLDALLLHCKLIRLEWRLRVMQGTRIPGARVVVEMVRSGAGSRGDLVRRLRLSKASVSRHVDRLLRQGILEEGAKVNGAPGRGRPVTPLRVRSDLGYLLGADLEGMAVRACLLDFGNKVVASDERPVGGAWSIARIVEAWLALIESVIERSGVPAERIVGLGVGLPGLVSLDGFRIHAYLPPGRWVDYDIGSALSRFGLPLTAANNVVCVSEYERRLGLLRGRGSFISILARYGVGAAVCSKGSFLIGEEEFTGELSHMRIDGSGPECICGRRGCLDVFASGRTWPEEAARSGPGWRDELQERTRCLAVGVANLLKVFRPSAVILNGIYNAYETEIGPVLRDALADELTPLGITVPDVLFGAPAPMKANIGAAFRAADAFLEQYLCQKVFVCRRND